MAWDTARTRAALLEAAVDEFAEYGFDGARVDRIGSRAGVNKERIYQYFGNKRQLFAHVLEHELERITTAVPLTEELAADLGAYAGRLYDFHRTHPQFIRLLYWEGLRDTGTGEPALNEPERSALYASRVRVLDRARESGLLDPELDPKALLSGVLALVAWWFTVPQAARMIHGAGRTPHDERETLIALVRRLTGQAASSGRSDPGT